MNSARFMVGRALLVGALLALGCSGDDGDEDGASGGADGDGGPRASGDPAFGNATDAQAKREPSDAAVAPPIEKPSGTSCGDNCFASSTGAGTDEPFDLTRNPSDGVGLDPEGSLVIERQAADAQQLIWVANTAEGTVSKVDTVLMQEVGRYEVTINANKQPGLNGPSRTSVDSDGNVYAGARYGDHVTKILAAGDQCADINGDGMVTTSTSATDVLPFGQDDCVAWTTDIGGDARGVAVQEIPNQFIIEPQPDGDPIITEIEGERSVWVGGQENDYKLHKLDAETGQILLTIVPPAPIYGLALDGRGNLWISGRKLDSIARVDTERCVDNSCGTETVCVTACDTTTCPSSCDDAVLERIELGVGQQTYGITVDCQQRIWVGGAHGGDGVRRYDPLAPADQRLAFAPDIAGDGIQGIHGIAADAAGWVWGAARDGGVWRIDAETLQGVQVTGTGGDEFSAKGMAIDRQGRVWGIPLGLEDPALDYALVITPGPTITEATLAKPIAGFGGPYTYSDMSGEQRRLASNEPGSYRQLFQGCGRDEKPTKWRDLSWEAELPDGTWVVFLARTADTIADLEDAEWFNLAAIPGRESPLGIEDFIKGANQAPGRYLEIDVRLFTTEVGSESNDGCTSVPAITPRVKRFGVSFECEPDLG